MIGLVVLSILLVLAAIVLVFIAQWKVFEKAGKEGYECLIPIHSTVVKWQIVGKPMWWIFFYLIPYVGAIIFSIWQNNLMAKSFGKGVGFTLGLIFLPMIFWPILGFGDATYQGPSAKEAQQA